MTWQPIETAPKDGTLVDLWVVNETGGGFRLADCRWGSVQYGARPARDCWLGLVGDDGYCTVSEGPVEWESGDRFERAAQWHQAIPAPR